MAQKFYTWEGDLNGVELLELALHEEWGNGDFLAEGPVEVSVGGILEILDGASVTGITAGPSVSAQAYYFWEGDLTTEFNFVELWLHEEWGNGDAFGEARSYISIAQGDVLEILDGTASEVLLIHRVPNKVLLRSQPRWLIRGTIGGQVRRYSSEDVEVP